MNNNGFAFVQDLIFTGFIVFGLLVLLLPQDRYRAVLGRYLPVGKSEKVRDLERRVFGLILTLFGAFALKGDLSSVYNAPAGGYPPASTSPASDWFNPGWLPFVTGILVVIAGSFVALNPELLVRWSRRRLFPDRQIPEGALRTWRLGLRLMGALMVFSSEALFRLWAGR